MKWGRKQVKQQQEEKMNSSSSFSISNVLPISWFSKLWNLSSKPKPTPTKPKRRTGPVSFPPPPPSPRQTSDSDHLSFSPAVLDHLIARFPASFHDAGSAPSRRSIGEDDSLLARDRTSHRRGITRSVRHNSVGQLEFMPPPSFSDPRSEFHFAESQPLGNLIPLSKRSSRNIKPASESEKSESDPTWERRRRRRRRRKRRNVRRVNDGPADETEGLPKLPLASDPDRTAQNRGGGQARKSFSGRIRPKVRVCSPRLSVASMAEMGRIKAAAAVAMRRMRRRVEADDKTGLESFAVVKCSCDPQKDFRESMVEMIWEKGIGRPEELERLLACYLWLNSDEHHDVIVKVFRQVWFDLNPERFSCRRFYG